MAAEAEAAGEPWPLPEDVSRFIDEQPIERVLEALGR